MMCYWRHEAQLEQAKITAANFIAFVYSLNVLLIHFFNIFLANVWDKVLERMPEGWFLYRNRKRAFFHVVRKALSLRVLNSRKTL